MGRIFCIPDIHGRKDLLDILLKVLIEQQNLDLDLDKLIFLGDMVDRGSDSKGVIDVIRNLQSLSKNVIALKGNHEDLMLTALRRGRYHDFELWMCNGGGPTLRSFGDPSAGTFTQARPVAEDYLVWLESLPLQHEEPGFFFSHAPVPTERRRLQVNQGKPFTQEELTWTYDRDEAAIARVFKDGRIGVCGHIHALCRGIFSPRYYRHYLFLDAGCGCHRDGPLVATEVTTKTPIWVYPPGVAPKPHRKRKYLPPHPTENPF